MQVPILSGVTVKDGAFVTSYPVNLEPRAVDIGVSKGQLVSARGAVAMGEGPGIDRGGIEWNGAQYRVMGSRLVLVSEDGAANDLGEVGSDGRPASFTYSFDRLAVRSGTALFYYDGTLTEVTDPDLGPVLDVEWIDGYFATTDGTAIVVTDLDDPFAVNPIKYGSAESDPDMITGLLRYREELYAFGRNTIQVFQNVGGNNFPFRAVRGATIPFGCVGPMAKCLIGGTFAFVGGARGEPLGVYLAGEGSAIKVSTREIDDMLAGVVDPATVEVEARGFSGERQLVVHLTDKSLGLALRTSQDANNPAWTVLHSGEFEPYRLRHAVLTGGRHWVGDVAGSTLGVLSEATAEHFGEEADWRFDAGLMFNEGMGAILNGVELFGRFPVTSSAVFFSLTRDGEAWSNEVARQLNGRPDERVVWRPGVRLPTMAGMRFRGRQRVGIARFDIMAEPLAA